MRFILTVILGLGLLMGPARASASMAQVVGRAAECIVDHGLGSFDIPLSAGSLTVLDFPGTLRKGAGFGIETQTDFNIQYDTRTLYIQPVPGNPDATLSMVVTTMEPAMQVRLFFRMTDSPDKALGMCRFVSRNQAEADQARIAAAVEQATRDRGHHEQIDRRRWQREQPIAMIQGRLHGQGELVPQVRHMRATNNKVAVRLGRALYHQGDLWTSFSIQSADWQPLRLANVQLTSRSGTITPLEDVILDPPARHHAQAIAELPVGQRASGLLRLPGVAAGVEPLEITFTGFTGARMVVVTAEEPIWVWVPRREDELREEQRQAAAEAAARDVLTLSLQGSYGAIWLGDGIDLDQSHATIMAGLGVRLSYALGRRFAVEAEAMGASTGSAYFEDVTYYGVTGDLVRSALLGRILLGGVLRLGEDRYVPLVRLGAGGQGSSHAAGFNRVSGPKLPFDVSALWYVGAGLDIRLGDHLLAGVGLTMENSVSSSYELFRNSIEAGIHLGYSWKP